jgi:hypothetical protein
MGVLFCISGIGSGHVSRCLPLIEALTADGHECMAAVTGYRAGSLLDGICEVVTPPPEFRERVAPVASDIPPFLLIPGLMAVPSAYQRDPVEGLKATVEFFGGVIDEFRPDLVVIDQVLGVAPLAMAVGVPVVQVTHGPFLPDFGPWAEESLVSDPRIEITPVDTILEEAFHAVTDQIPSIDDLMRGELILIPCHPSFGTCEGAFHYRSDRLPEPRRESSDDQGPPMVLSYLSFRARELGTDVIRGILGAGCRAVVVDGEEYELPEDLAGNPMVEVLGRVPIEDLLSEAVAIVHGGGSVLTQEAVAAGVPQVAIPRNTEQGVTATALERLGAGVVTAVSSAPMEAVEISGGFTTLGHTSVEELEPRITSALIELVDNERASAVAYSLGDEIRALPAVADAVAQIETLLGTQA